MGGGNSVTLYGGDTAVMRGDIELMGSPPVSFTRENPGWSWIKFLANDTSENIYQPLTGDKSIVYSGQ